MVCIVICMPRSLRMYASFVEGLAKVIERHVKKNLRLQSVNCEGLETW